MNENRLRRIASQPRPRARSGVLKEPAVVRHHLLEKSVKYQSILFRRCTLLTCAAAFCLISLIPAARGQSNQAPTDTGRHAETITVNLDAPSHPFPHFWEQMYGSGRAV